MIYKDFKMFRFNLHFLNNISWANMKLVLSMWYCIKWVITLSVGHRITEIWFYIMFPIWRKRTLRLTFIINSMMWREKDINVLNRITFVQNLSLNIITRYYYRTSTLLFFWPMSLTLQLAIFIKNEILVFFF